MKTTALLLFLVGFVTGMLVAPQFTIQEEPVSEPVHKPVEHQRNKQGEKITRIA